MEETNIQNSIEPKQTKILLVNKRYFRFFLVICILAILGILTKLVFNLKTKSNQQVLQTKNLFEPKIRQVETDKIPDYFPQELVMEKDVKVLENFTVLLEGDFTQSTRSIESSLGNKLGLEKVFEIYSDKLKEQKWFVTEESAKNKEDKKLSARKKSDTVTILFKKMENNSINIYIYAIIKTNN